MHEHAVRHEAPVKSSSDRSFGQVFAGVFALIGLFPLLHGGRICSWSMLAALACAALAFIAPTVLAPANRLWTSFGTLLHRVVSPVALGILFFLVVTPIGLSMRLFGTDTLRLRKDSEAASYWLTREPPGPAPESLDRQF